MCEGIGIYTSPLPMNLKFFVGWANSFIVCPRGTRYEKLRGHCGKRARCAPSPILPAAMARSFLLLRPRLASEPRWQLFP